MKILKVIVFFLLSTALWSCGTCNKKSKTTLVQVKYQLCSDVDTLSIDYAYYNLYLNKGNLNISTSGGFDWTTLASGVRSFKIIK